MLRRILLSFYLLFIVIPIFSQNGGGPPHTGAKGNVTGGRPPMTGRFYGKVLDSISGKSIEFAPVQLWQNKWDSTAGVMKKNLVNGQLTEPNGDFSLENLPMFGKFILKIAPLGYSPYEKEVTFDKPIPGQMPNTDKDLGNIRLSPDAKILKEAVVEGSTPTYKMDIDKKVFNVDKNAISAGGTAEDVMKNVPSVNVDPDGNVTVRNNAPQIFVDGRPTTLALNQIPADAIESIEVITNPSAKYDAEGGGGGILNIVMKKNRKMGYYGNIRAGVDKFGKFNAGADLNIRQGKVNFFLNGNYNQRKNVGYSETNRTTNSVNGSYPMRILQTNNNNFGGFFGFGKAGLDYFIDNRNTLTFSQSYTTGHFNPLDQLMVTTDTLISTNALSSYYGRNSDMKRHFVNHGSALLFKHLFPKQGKEITADINFQRVRGWGDGSFQTQNYYPLDTPIGQLNLQQQTYGGATYIITAQTDYVNQLTEKSKLEAGARINIQDFTSHNENYNFDYILNEYVLTSGLSSNYAYHNQVYAAYATYSNKIAKFGYQAGLRVESSDYKGKLLNTNQEFKNQYPISLFPSGFLSYNFNEKNEVQLSYTRRVNRPNFFQLMPYIDYADSLNLRHGNPSLLPEFTHSMELNYQHPFNRANTFIATAYYKNTQNIITNFQTIEYSDALKKDAVFTTFMNANSSYSYGLELTSKNNIKGILDITANVNLYNSGINGTNIQSSLSNQLFSWFAKLNLSLRLPKNFTYQVSGDYQAKSIVPPTSSGGGGGGGGMNFGPSPSNVQGYIKPRYAIDMALRYDFLKNRNASVTFSVSDVFKMRVFDTYSISPYFTQNVYRYQNQQYYRLNFSYRFGKMDASLFKRKNNRVESDAGM